MEPLLTQSMTTLSRKFRSISWRLDGNVEVRSKTLDGRELHYERGPLTYTIYAEYRDMSLQREGLSAEQATNRFVKAARQTRPGRAFIALVGD